MSNFEHNIAMSTDDLAKLKECKQTMSDMTKKAAHHIRQIAAHLKD